MNNQYIISGEFDLPGLTQIVRKNKVETFRESLDNELKLMGKETLWVPSNTIRIGLNRLVSKSSLPIVSLDDRYVTSSLIDSYIGVSRGVTSLLKDDGYVPRRNYDPINTQLEMISKIGNKITLVDDVIFSGGMIEWMFKELKKYGVMVELVVCGIAIQEGIDKLQELGIKLEAVETFDNVEDEICERDFAMVAGSGRRIDSLASNSLYFDVNYGNPSVWASIPTQEANEFCRNSIERSIRLLKPGIPIQVLGSFLGYNNSGDAVSSLKQRILKL